MIVVNTPAVQMGNKMFLYAMARSLAKARKLTYCFEGNLLDALECFEIPDSKLSHKINTIIFRIQNKIPGMKYTFYHNQDNRKNYADEMLHDASKYVWYYGYMQGLQYFYGNEAEIKKLFTIKEKFKLQYKNAIQKINPENKKLLTVHIRLKDYKTFGPDYLGGPDLSLPFSYYHNLLKKYSENDYKIVVLSDEIETVKSEFSYLKQVYFSTENMIVDFQLLQNSDVCIAAHSTFSWWASWLNRKTDKVVYVPNYFLGFKVKMENPVGIIPKGWIKVDIEN
jgi:hypothetical protein